MTAQAEEMKQPQTEAGKALLSLAIIEDDDPVPVIVMYRDLMKERVVAIEAEAQALILSDVEGLAQALERGVPEAVFYPEQAEAILAAWRQGPRRGDGGPPMKLVRDE